jgi:hypothetical protein
MGGLVHDDTRFLSRWELKLNGRRFSLLKSGTVDYYSAAFFVVSQDLPGLPVNCLAGRRLRFVGSGVLEQIELTNSTPEPIRFELRLVCGADFADLFEIRAAVRDRRANIITKHGRRLLQFHYEVPGFLAETTADVERSEIIEGVSERLVRKVPVGFANSVCEVRWLVCREDRICERASRDLSAVREGGSREVARCGFVPVRGGGGCERDAGRVR